MNVGNRQIAEDPSLKIAFLLAQGFTVSLATLHPQTSFWDHIVSPAPLPSNTPVYLCLSTYRVFAEGIIPTPPHPWSGGEDEEIRADETRSAEYEKRTGWAPGNPLRLYHQRFKCQVVIMPSSLLTVLGSLWSPSFLTSQEATTQGCPHGQNNFLACILDTELEVQIGMRWGHKLFWFLQK